MGAARSSSPCDLHTRASPMSSWVQLSPSVLRAQPHWLLFWLLDTWNPCSPWGLCKPSPPCQEPLLIPTALLTLELQFTSASTKRLVPSWVNPLVSFIRLRVSNYLISLPFIVCLLLLEYSMKGGALSVTHYYILESEGDSRSVVSDSFVTPWPIAHQAPLSVGFSR